MPPVSLTKRLEFSASHRYHNDAWDDGRNRAVFGSCNRAPGHGHNYLLEVTVGGTVSPSTGMVVNLYDLKVLLKDVLKDFDHKHLNLDTPYFEHRIPTTENIATVLWSILAIRLDTGTLERVRLFEEEDLHAEVTPALIARGEALVTRRYHFSAAHRLGAGHLATEENRGWFGGCHSPALHGHNYALEIAVGGRIAQETGMVIDLALLDRTVRDTVLARFDGRTLNEDPAFSSMLPTGENLSRVIWDALATRMHGGRLERVGLSEGRDRAYQYVGDAENREGAVTR